MAKLSAYTEKKLKLMKQLFYSANRLIHSQKIAVEEQQNIINLIETFFFEEEKRMRKRRDVF